jgi:hypothetical protein
MSNPTNVVGEVICSSARRMTSSCTLDREVGVGGIIYFQTLEVLAQMLYWRLPLELSRWALVRVARVGGDPGGEQRKKEAARGLVNGEAR